MEYFTEKKKAIISAKDIHNFKKVKVIVVDLHEQDGYGVITVPEMNNLAVAEILSGEIVWQSS